MSTEVSPRLGLDYVMAAQAQKHVTVNESLRRLDALVQATAISGSIDDQPATPAEGDVYIITGQASGDEWTLMSANTLAVYRDAEWAGIEPREGWRIWVEDEQAVRVFHDGNWQRLSDSITTLQELQLFGLGTSADSANPFAAKLNAALWTARSAGEGGTGDLRYTLNREAAGNTLSLLFQSAYSGRAELGLIGDDAFRLKLSADGTVWQDVLQATPERFDVLATAGLRATAINDTAPATRRNRILNGDFRIAQRGNSFAAASAGDRLFDGWKLASTGNMICDITRADFVPGQAEIPGSPRHYMEWQLSGTATGSPMIEQRIEGVDSLSPGSATLSYFARADRLVAFKVIVRRHFGSGGSASDTLMQDTMWLTTGWTRYVIVVPAASLDGKTIGADHSLALEFNLLDGETSVDIALADVQFEPGDVATPFERLSFAESLQNCQRYFAKTYAHGHLPGSTVVAGALQSSTGAPGNTALFDWRLPVEMRTVPSVTVFSPQTGMSGKIDAAGTDLAASSLSLSPVSIAIQSASHSGLDLAAAHIVATAEL